jgi:hypothetical protein
MVAKPGTTLVVVAVIAAALLAPKGARAFEVKKSLYSNTGPSGNSGNNGPTAPGPAKENPIPTAQRQQLSDTIASESDSFLSEESEKKSSGKGTYVDLEHAKFMYLPTMKAGKWTVIAKLQAAEYTPSKSGEGKGKPTGKQRVLIFNYRLDGSKWAEVEPPKWEDVADANAPATAAKK